MSSPSCAEFLESSESNFSSRRTDEKRRLEGLKLALDLNYTVAQFEEAVKLIDSPDNLNQLVNALVDVSNRQQHEASGDMIILDNGQDNQTSTATTSTTSSTDNVSLPPIALSTSGCYTSINSIPSFNPGLRKIFIDGPNVAMTHGKNTVFSWLGIKICVNWFLDRNHRVKVFVPEPRCRNLNEANKIILDDLNQTDCVVSTPDGCSDDLFLLEASKQINGIIVSNDLFRDETRFKKELENFVQANRLPYIFVDDLFIPAQDPRGRAGPSLDEFLRDQTINQQTKLHRTKSHQRFHKSGFSPHARRQVRHTRSLHNP